MLSQVYITIFKTQLEKKSFDLVKNDANMKFYTSVPNTDSFEGLHSLTSPMIKRK